MEQDGANLIDDLIIRAFGEGCNILQYKRRRAVCKEWRRVLTPSSCPREAPWLMIPRPYVRHRFLSFQFELPQDHRASYIHGSSHGWLVLKYNNRIRLYNPMNGSNISGLPCNLSHPPRIRISNRPSLWKVLLSCNPSNAQGCVIVAGFIPGSTWELGFCRIGDHHWTILKTYVGPRVRDFTFLNNSVYTVDEANRLTVYNLQNWDQPESFPFSYPDNMNPIRVNLVQGTAGLHIVASSAYTWAEIRTPIHVFLWNTVSRQWQRVTNVTDRQLFLSLNQCCAVQLEEHQGNILHYALHTFSNNSDSVGINRVNLENDIFVPDVLLNPIEISNAIVELPSWFTPSLM